MHLLLPYSTVAVLAAVCAGLCFLLPETRDMPTLENMDSVKKDSASKAEDTENGNLPLKPGEDKEDMGELLLNQSYHA